jgi:hypothetical protein
MFTGTLEELPGRTGTVSTVGAFGFNKSWRYLAPGVDYHQGVVLASFIAQTGIDIGYRWIVGNPVLPQYEEFDLYCVELRADEGARLSDGVEWIISGVWQPADPLLLGPSAIGESWEDTPVKISFGTWDEEFALYLDKDGYVLLNSAGDRFAEPFMAQATYDLIRVSRFERTYDPNIGLTYRQAVNSAEFTIRGITIPARQAKIVRLEPGDELWHQQIGRYFRVTYDIALRPLTWNGGHAADVGQGWDLRVANIGYRQKVSSALQVIVENNGAPVSEPRPLDSSTGAVLAYPLAASTAMPQRSFRVRNEVDFRNLKFPVA